MIMKTGDKIVEGYKALSEGKWEGSYLFMSGVAELYLVDEIDDIIYGNLLNYVATVTGKEGETEADQWLKLLLLDFRFGKVMLEHGDLMENIRKYANGLETVSDDYIIQNMLDGSIGKIKWVDGSYYTIQFDYEKGLQFLVRVENNVLSPMDFDVEDFRVNRPAKRIEFSYTRGNRKVMSVNLDGSDKRELERTELYPENK